MCNRMLDTEIVKSLVIDATSGDLSVVARLLNHFYGDRFVCTSAKHKYSWYEYRNNKWEKYPFGLRRYIWSEIKDLFKEEAKNCTDCIEQMTNEDDKALMTRTSKEYARLSHNLGMTNTINRLMKEYMNLYEDPDFEKRLDVNKSLLGFENGIYDLSTGEFREGKKSDYVSLSTGYNYSFEDDPDIQSDILNFIESITPNHEVLLESIAKMLDAEVGDVWFYVGCGGRNGISTLLALLRSAFGDHRCMLNLDGSARGGIRLMIGREEIKNKRDLLRTNANSGRPYSIIHEMVDFPGYVSVAKMNSVKLIEFPYHFVMDPQCHIEKLADMTLKERFRDEKYSQQFMRILFQLRSAV
jgi:hypothetical protein